ncbi:S1-like domain-containing RNA-binding protein [Flavobacteriaceae bacterium]|nr:S1-like domain-containing RNA-binding protein [Flavobacteriaceae bacterium]MDB4187694.1 S1-like domain-containing RNA-binding protein [Flavobacteriaceae bacterium]
MEYQIGDQVALIVVRSTQLGYVVQIDDENEGLVFKNDIYQPLENGDEVKGYIKFIREDGKIDVSLRPQGFKNVIDPDCDTLFNYLKKKNSLYLTDKSSPDEIRTTLNMSKKAFKKAVGFLYKRKVIVLHDDRIELLKKKNIS